MRARTAPFVTILPLVFVVLTSALGCETSVEEEDSAATASSLGEQTSARSKIVNVQYEVQQTGYWCGPASARIALSARMPPPSQGTLAQQLGTTTNGTDWIGQVTSTLNARLGSSIYATHEMPNDPPSAAQRSALLDDIVQSIDAGYPVVANIVAPPSNHPPGYPNRTIYHYLTVIGYDLSASKVYIADPASFSGNTHYWLSFQQLASLIPPKGYSAAKLPGTECAGGSGKVVGLINAKYVAMGGCQSFLGKPITNERGTPDNRGRYSVFDNGSIYWTADTGAVEVHGVVRDKWRDLGWEAGPLGYPITDEQGTPDRAGRYSVFEHGSIYWKADLGAHEVRGRIRDAWRDAGWEAGSLGYPISDEHDVPEGRQSDFEHGSITWHAATNTTTTSVTQ